MKSRSLEALGIPLALVPLAQRQVAEARRAGLGLTEARLRLAAVVAAPADFTADPSFAPLAAELVALRAAAPTAAAPRTAPVPWRQ